MSPEAVTESPTGVRSGPEQVSCQALQVFFEYVEARGGKREELTAGLGWPKGWLDGRGNWVDYTTLCAVEQRLAAMYPDEAQLFFDVGFSVGRTSGLGFLRTLSRTLISPFQVYLRLPGLMRRFLFRFFRVRYERTSRSSVRGEYRFDPGCPPTAEFLETARGVLSGLPVLLGAPAAQVVFERRSEYEVVVDVRFEQWLGPVGLLRSGWDGIRRWISLRLLTPVEAGLELEETNRLLHEKVDALSAAKVELDQRVHDLADLRDNLALRVSERTAELEIARSRLEDTVELLQRADRARAEFFTNVSHEFKTPLTLILASIDELTSAEPQGGGRRAVRASGRHAAQWHVVAASHHRDPRLLPFRCQRHARGAGALRAGGRHHHRARVHAADGPTARNPAPPSGRAGNNGHHGRRQAADPGPAQSGGQRHQVLSARR